MPQIPTKIIEVYSPIKGDDKTSAREQQDPMQHVWDSLNVLPYDRFERNRVAQRSGLSPLFINHPSTSSLVTGMLPVNQIVYPGQVAPQAIIPQVIPPSNVKSTSSTVNINRSTTTGFIFNPGPSTFTLSTSAAFQFTGVPASTGNVYGLIDFGFVDSAGIFYSVEVGLGPIAPGSGTEGGFTQVQSNDPNINLFAGPDSVNLDTGRYIGTAPNYSTNVISTSYIATLGISTDLIHSTTNFSLFISNSTASSTIGFAGFTAQPTYLLAAGSTTTFPAFPLSVQVWTNWQNGGSPDAADGFNVSVL